MMKKLLPDYTAANVDRLDKEFYEKNNIKAVVFDIDNTLVAHTEPKPPKNVTDYFCFLKSIGVKYAVVSNNKIDRVRSFCGDLGIPWYGKALKPRKKYIKKVFDEMGISPKYGCLVGDQLFTDIYGGNRMKLKTVLVTAVGEDETSFVSFKRRFEKRILMKYSDRLNEYIPSKQSIV